VSVDLFIVRHAIAYERDRLMWPDDRDRPLTEDGEASFRVAARGLRKVAPMVGAVFTSPLVRAAQTAAILQEVVGWPAAARMPELEPDVPPDDVLAALAPLPLPTAVALVGHEPSLSHLIGALVGDAEVDLKKGGIARLDVEVFKRGGARLRWLLPPKVLRAAK